MDTAQLRTPSPRQSCVLAAPPALTGDSLYDLMTQLEIALIQHPASIVVDLAGVQRISMVAQAVLLSMERRLRSRGTTLVLGSPSDELREQGRGLDLFGRIRTVDHL
jgi:anti-anti-sigma regulatory factor